MKKRKVGFLFNIITICLAVVAIAVGVYSLQKSSLNISGSLGFTAHSVNARIDAYMYGYATTANGIPLTESEKVRLTETNGLLIHDKATSYSLKLGATNGSGNATRYFSNLGASGKMEDIVVEIIVSNTSGGTSTPKNILANVDFANCIPSSALTDKIRIDCDRSAAVLETTNGKTQETFTFKISLLPNSDGTYTNSALTSPSNNVSLKMNLEETTYKQSQVRTDAIAIKKFTPEYVNNLRTTLNNLKLQYGPNNFLKYNDTVKCYAERYPYYVEMGHVGNDYIKWLVVGTKGASDTDAVTTLVDADKTALSQGLLLNKTYVMLSEKVLYSESTTNYGISFQNKYEFKGPSYLNEYGYSSQDYATSNIRAYLNGETVQRDSKKNTDKTKYIADGASVNLLTTYNLTSDPLYAKIQERTLTSLYTNIGAAAGTIWSSSDSRTEENLQPTTLDKLWLLSETEMNEVFKFAEDLVNSSYRASAVTTVYGTVSGRSSWWLRSFSQYQVFVGSYMDHCGSYHNGGTYDSSFGSRPAFLF